MEDAPQPVPKHLLESLPFAVQYPQIPCSTPSSPDEGRGQKLSEGARQGMLVSRWLLPCAGARAHRVKGLSAHPSTAASNETGVGDID